MSRVCCNVAIALDTLHKETAMPMTTAADVPETRFVAVATAALNTPAAPDGSPLASPWVSVWRVPELRWMSVRMPRAAITAGNRAKNRLYAKLPEAIVTRSSFMCLSVRARTPRHPGELIVALWIAATEGAGAVSE